MAQAHSLTLSPQVDEAIRSGAPVVALESTVITHGLPRSPRALGSEFCDAFREWDGDAPVNLACARACERAVRALGATPATIAILDGQVRVGLSDDELTALAALETPAKVSLRDLGPTIARRRSGGTTVAATTAIAARAGIRVFATGGIGGVHRGWRDTMDISADLRAVATNAVVVVSAGPKIILDLPATLEAIESLGIPLLGVSSRALPRFTVEPEATDSLPDCVKSAADAAEVATSHWRIVPHCGLLVFNACPAAFALRAESVERSLDAAFREARVRGITGAKTTPFLLAQLAGNAQGGLAALRANLALLISNARLAAQVAGSIAAMIGPHSGA
ncbi:MAG: pseudouridine-5'-phosphate glycosidase [Phycisphaerales bacterium]|nr:pseudouridine-5'-phosphate glycosidase [Phycisphaerales bacterium]